MIHNHNVVYTKYNSSLSLVYFITFVIVLTNTISNNNTIVVNALTTTITNNYSSINNSRRQSTSIFGIDSLSSSLSSPLFGLQQQQQNQNQPVLARRNNNKRRTIGHGLVSSVSRSSLSLSSSENDNNNNNNNNNRKMQTKMVEQVAQFEYQELKIILTSMQQQQITVRNLPISKRNELINYIKTIIINRPSTPSIWVPETIFKTKLLPNTQWQLVFSTETSIIGELPKDATIVLNFINTNTLEYILQFSSRTIGLKNLKAICTWDISYNSNNNPGCIEYRFDKVTTDIFGLTNINIGLFSSMIVGRINRIDTVYIDNELWIEQGLDDNGQYFYNVYMKQQ